MHRMRVEALIVRGDKVLVGLFTNANLWGLPGGTVEDGDTVYDTILRECLEEVGVRVKNVRMSTDLYYDTTPDEAYTVRRTAGASRTVVAIAEFDKYDDYILGADGDDMDFKWVTMKDMETEFSKDAETPYNKRRLRVIRAVRKLSKTKSKVVNRGVYDRFGSPIGELVYKPSVKNKITMSTPSLEYYARVVDDDAIEAVLHSTRLESGEANHAADIILVPVEFKPSPTNVLYINGIK